MISFSLRLTKKQHEYLHFVKQKWGLGMGSQIRLLLRNEMLGINNERSVQPEQKSSNDKSPVIRGRQAFGQAAVVAELKRLFEARTKRR